MYYNQINPSSYQGLPYNEGSIMNFNSSLSFARKHSERNRILTLFSNAESEHCDKVGVPSLDYLHINLLYCGGTVSHDLISYMRSHKIIGTALIVYVASYPIAGSKLVCS